MMPSLGIKYEIEIETITKPRAEYRTREYLKQGLPAVPAIMVGNEIVIAGSNISVDKLEAVICRHLGLSTPEPQKKSLTDRLFKSN